jgi:hypothetical protein
MNNNHITVKGSGATMTELYNLIKNFQKELKTVNAEYCKTNDNCENCRIYNGIYCMTQKLNKDLSDIENELFYDKNE